MVADKDLKIKYKALPFAKNSGASVLFGGPDERYFRNLGNRVEFPNNDTIYSYDGNTLTAKCLVVYDDKADLSSIDKVNNVQGRIFSQYVSDGVTQTAYLTRYSHPYESRVIVRNEKSGHSFVQIKGESNDNIDLLLFFWTRALEDRDFCVSLDNEDMTDLIEETPEFINRLTPEQQKVLKTDEEVHWLVFFKFKDF
jgi:hypothetical protein